MKTVSYSGPTISLGRFGTIDDGAHLQLTEAEYAGLSDDSRFTLLSRRKIREDISPLGTPYFDLRLVDWSRKNLQNELTARGKSTLKNIAEAINFIGGDVVVTEHDNSDIIADAIYAEAVQLGWDKLGKETRLALGTADTAVVKGAKDANVAAKAVKAPAPVASADDAEVTNDAPEEEETTQTKRRRR
jgi:hypothetical protein